jgi:hypothetical protein
MADMDRQMNTLMRQAAAAQPGRPAAPGQVAFASTGKLPAGTMSYHYVAINNGKTSCTQSVQVVSQGPNQQPKVVKASSGDCKGVQMNLKPGTISAPVPARPPVPTRPPQPARPPHPAKVPLDKTI